MGLLLELGKGGSRGTERQGRVEDASWANPEGEEVLAFEAIDSLDERLDALDAKVAALDGQLVRAETKLEQIVASLYSHFLGKIQRGIPFSFIPFSITLHRKV